MVRDRAVVLMASVILVLSAAPRLAPASPTHLKSNAKVKPSVVPAPDAKDFDVEAQLVASNPGTDSEAVVRRPAGSSAKVTGSEDLMTPELKAFRDKLLKCRHAEDLEPLLKEYDAKYDTLPNDLKYVVARLSPILAFRGFVWRMATLAHQSVVSQELALAMVRSFAEQVMVFEPDAQWQAYLTFLSIPSPAQVVPGPDKGDGVKRPDQRFYVENDLSDFLATDVYRALGTAIKRLAKLQTTVTIGGKQTPIVFDNRIRFGDEAFGQSYDAVDRFALIGDAERYAAMARYHRRMATIAQMAAYNMNGNIALRREIGKKYGVDAMVSGAAGEALSVDGLTRIDRVAVARAANGVFTLRNKEWMKTAYLHLNKWAEYNAKAWDRMQHDRDGYDMLLDPDVFAGRKDQTDKSIANLRTMLPNPKEDGLATIHGAISGDELRINIKDFFFNPPSDLKSLMPTEFHHHEDAQPLASVYGADNLKFNDDRSTVEMKVKVGSQVKEVEWRNYSYGRAVGWDHVAFARLFPGVASDEQVARDQRILSEARGGRPLLNTLTVFVK